ncbi:MAG: erythromycin esterase family protein [Phycisphaerales bacterium]|nr:MAG: erythromycin esterase family protein [Phycisphaerales bacterium]
MLGDSPNFSRSASRLALAICAGLMLSASAAARGQAESATEEEFVKWASGNAVELGTLDWRELDLDNLSFLDEALEGKRIVYLGEADHYVHEKWDYQMILIRYLVEHGWRTIGMEMGYGDCKKINRYIETGDESRLADVGWKALAACGRADRDDRITMFSAAENEEFISLFQGEMRWLLDQLRIINDELPPGEPRVRWFGFDVTSFPWCGYQDVTGLLEGHESDPLIAELLKRLELCDGETRLGEAQRLHDAAGFVSENEGRLKGILGSADTRELKRVVSNLADSYEFLDAAVAGGGSPKWLPALSRREESMGRLMSDLLDDTLKGEKIIMIGHILHLCKDSDTVCLGPVGSGYPGMWLSIGTQLQRKLPGEVYSIWFTYDHGRHGNITLPEGFEDVPSNPARFESLLARACDGPCMLPLNGVGAGSAYLDEPRNFLQNGSTASGMIKRQADAIFFIPEVTGLSAR